MDKEIILIAEDNEILRSALQEMLAEAGYAVIAAENGVEALKRMAFISPNLIISDIAMPEMDGHQFFKSVRKKPEWVSIPFIFLTARGTKEDVLNGRKLGVEDYLVKPVHRDELLTAVRSRLSRSNQLRIYRLRQAYESSLTVLANAIEVRDRYTRGHVERVRDYALMLAEQLGWSEQQLDELRFAAILHDIGKIHIRESTLRKEEPLTEDEWEEIKQHPIIGEAMIKDIPYLTSAIPAIRHHHERWDGSGYPDQLVGDSIPPMARIVAVADAFDAMTSTRTYQEARSLEKALGDIKSGAGKRYDPDIVDVLVKAWEDGLVHEIASK